MDREIPDEIASISRETEKIMPGSKSPFDCENVWLLFSK